MTEHSETHLPETSAARKWLAVVLLFIAVLINYVDRGNLSVAAVPMMRDFRISPAIMGTLLSAFFWTYSLMQIPAGYIVDRFNLKWLYAGAFLLWSLASASVGIAQSFQQIVILRLVLGFAETVAHPASIGFIQRNFRGAEQGLPTSIYLAGMQVGPALGALLGSWLLQTGGWRWLFVVTGLGACVWLVPWLALVPAESRYKSMQRSIYMATAPSFWFRLFTTPLVAGVLLGAFFYSYYWFFCLTWLPSYLVIARGFSFLKMGTFTALPLTGMAIVSIFSARVADRIIARIDRPLLVRKAFVVSGFVLGSSILALPLLVSSFAVLTVMLSSSVGIGIASANFWAIVQIISPQAMIGRVIGVQNTIASVAGICAPLVTGLLVDRMKRFDLAIVVAGLSLLLAAACFAFLVREKDAQELHRRFSQSLGPVADS